tara:strand:- start:6348 stop:6620 length:273 start_codon:yes stop_codon:yes gene_type:complete
MINAEILRVMQQSNRPMSAGEIFMAGCFDVSPSSVYVALNKMCAAGGRGVVDKTGSNKSFVYELRRGADTEEYLVRNSKARNHGARRRAA